MLADGDFDFIVVGAGSASCTLASRLSENPGTRVLLIEAGPDTPPDNVPALIRDIGSRASAEPGWLWPGLLAEAKERPGSNAPGLLQRFEQARVMGGGSSLMGMFALRGLPSDYDDWEAQGVRGPATTETNIRWPSPFKKRRYAFARTPLLAAGDYAL